MTEPLRATAVPGGVTHYWRAGWSGTICGIQRPPRILPWAPGAWPRDCKRCLKVRAAIAKPKGA